MNFKKSKSRNMDDEIEVVEAEVLTSDEVKRYNQKIAAGVIDFAAAEYTADETKPKKRRKAKADQSATYVQKNKTQNYNPQNIYKRPFNERAAIVFWKNPVCKFFRVILFKPASYLSTGISIVMHFLGFLLLLAIPIGIYYGYTVFREVSSGVSLFDAQNLLKSCVFILAPAVAAALSKMFENLGLWLDIHS